MDFDTKTAPHPESVKKPYEAPKLVVLGDATEMTQAATGAVSDGIGSPTAVVS